MVGSGSSYQSQSGNSLEGQGTRVEIMLVGGG